MSTHSTPKTLYPTVVFKPTLLASAITVACTSFAYAQEEQEEEAIEAITVTATKRAQVIYEVPIAISAFAGDALAEQGITDLTDVGKFVPNLNVTGFSAGHTSSANPFIRGIGLQDHLITTDPGVSVYVDGVYLGRQVGQNWNLNNIERIEVLRGPQGTLYGRNSIGGAINIITKQPDEVAITKLGVEGGSRGRAKADVFVNRELSDKLAFNFNAGYNSRDGIGEFINVASEYDVGETNEFYGRLSVRYAPNDDFSLVLTADANDNEGGLRPYTTFIDEVGAPRYVDGQNGLGVALSDADVAANPYDNATGTEEVTTVTNKASGISLTADWNWSDTLSSKVIVSSRSSEYKAGLDDDSTVYELDHYPERGEADQTSIEFQLNGYIGDVDFVSGLYWFKEDGSNLQDPSEANFDGGGTLLDLDQETESRAIFVNVGFDVSDALRLSGGLRYTEDEKQASANVWPDLGPITDEDSWDELTWELAANYTFDSGLNWYGTVQSGYQSGQYPARPYFLIGEFFGAGGYDDLANTIATVQANNGFLASDNITAVNFETGLKGQVTDWFSMSLALFNTEYEDLPYQVSQTGENGFDTFNLVVEQTSRGIEWESTAYFTDNFKLHASFGYMDVDVQEIDGVKPVAPLTPDLTASISPSYAMELESGATVDFRVDYSFRDDMYGEPSSDPGRNTLIQSRELVNLDITYTSADDDWSVSLYGRNIFDERYDNARLNTGEYLLVILSNDASEFGARFNVHF